MVQNLPEMLQVLGLILNKITTLELFNVHLTAIVSVGLVANSDHAAEWNG